MEIRDAIPADWPAVAALLAQLGRPDVRGGPKERRARRLFQSYLERADTAAIVADVDGKVVGLIAPRFR